MRAPRVRTYTEFAEQEIIVPDGPMAGQPFRFSTHPAARLLYRELDSGRWQRIFVTGPNQDAKSLAAFVIPSMYVLFERRERLLLGVPSDAIAEDKWTLNLLPAIRASRYKDLLPTSGAGSRGGWPELIEFRNGAALRWMTAGGDDQSRAHFTTPNLHVSETEGFDEVGGNSKEGDKFSQLERRLLAYGAEGRLLAECTVGVEEGRTWHEYRGGTESRIALPCPHCRAWVTPEREHFVGWQDAASDGEASQRAYLACPACGDGWTNEQRIEANQRAVLVHRGQRVEPDGTVVGEPPNTNTLGFRWTVVNSIFRPERLPLVGGEEYRAARANDADVAELDLCQKQWVIPAKSATVDLARLEQQVIAKRTTTDPRGRVPSNCDQLVVTVDVGKWQCHWVAVATEPDGTPHVVEYDRLQVPSDQMGDQRAVLAALREFRDRTVADGWDSDLGPMAPAVCLVDSGWQTDVVYAFCRESGEPWLPSKGFGTLKRYGRAYAGVKQKGPLIAFIGEDYHLARLRKDKVRLVEFNADRWKSRVHDAWQTPVGKPGAAVLYAPDAAEKQPHGDFSRHQCSEKCCEEFVAGVGTVKRWHVLTKHNHWLDAMALAGVANHYAGHRAPSTSTWAKTRSTAPAAVGRPAAPDAADAAAQESDEAARPAAPDAREGGWWSNRRRRR